MPEITWRRLAVIIAELKDHGPMLRKLVNWMAATKEIIGTTHASGRRAPTTASTARVTSSNAWHISVARKDRFCGRTSSSLAAATPRAKAAIGGRCRAACAHWPPDANTEN